MNQQQNFHLVKHLARRWVYGAGRGACSAVLAVGLATLVACGGGGGSQESPPAGADPQPQVQHMLTVQALASGTGTITSSPPGIACGADCTQAYDAGTLVTLTAVPQAGFDFTGWAGGACSGTGTCVVDLDAAVSVSANFTAQAPGTRSLSVSVSGSGSVSSSPAGIDCGSSCVAAYTEGTVVTLTAAPGTGATFAGWNGSGCSGTGTCVVTLSAARSVTATFSSPAAAGKTYFVATTGSDTANGTSLGTPFKTLKKAVSVAAAGDVIEVRAGTYVEADGGNGLVIRTQGTAAAPITMRGFNGERPVITSNGAGPTVYFYNSRCDQDTVGNASGNTTCFASHWVMQGLEIQGSKGGSGDGNAIKIDTANVKLVGNKLCCSVADVVKLVRTANDVQILDNEIFQDAAKVTPGANAQGVDIVGADRARVAGNFIHDVPDFGVYAKGNARNPVFEDNRLVNIGRADNGHALMLGQETDEERLVDGRFETYDGIVRNNVVVGSTWACLAVSSSSNAHFYNNSCFNTATNSQASIFISNESIVNQVSVGLQFVNNIVYGSANRPVFKLNSDAMTDTSTLLVEKNLFFVDGGDPRFVVSDTSLNFATWKTRYKALTGLDDTSLAVANPQYASTTGTAPLTLGTSSPVLSVAGKDTSSEVPTDRLGVKRPLNGKIEVGAYEY
jgi:hypothetical protein